jgi:rare lipoprotein A
MQYRLRRAIALFVCVTLFACAELPREPEKPAESPPTASAPPSPPRASQPSAEEPTGTKQRGRISFYGDAFEGRKTASGEPFDPDALTMAHRTLPFGTRVRVTNIENKRSVDVVVNDRGPFVTGRIADLSRAAALRIGMFADGVVEALLEVLELGKAR